MSHFTVLVVGPNPEAQLKPYDENIRVEPYPCPASKYSIEAALEQLKKKNPDRTWTTADGSPADDFTLQQIVAELNDDEFDLADDGDEEHLVHDGKVCYMSQRNPDSKWDWYVVGGRWCGYFPLKEGVEWKREMIGDPSLLKDELAQVRRDRLVDVVAAGNVDFDRARAEAEKKARELFATWRALFESHGRPRGWKEFQAQIDAEIAELEKAGVADEIVGERHDPGIGKLIPARTYKISRQGVVRERLTEQYRAQPAIAASWNVLRMLECPVDWYGFDEDAHAARMRRAALVPYALVKDGKWYAKGEMGWWAMSRNEKDEDRWCEEVTRLYDDLPPDTLLTLFDCHI